MVLQQASDEDMQGAPSPLRERIAGLRWGSHIITAVSEQQDFHEGLTSSGSAGTPPR